MSSLTPLQTSSGQETLHLGAQAPHFECSWATTMTSEHPDDMDIEGPQTPRVQEMTVLGTQVALHKMGQSVSSGRP